MSETRYWTWHMAAAVAILALLGLHMVTMHMGSVTGLFVENRAIESVAKENSQARDANILFPVIYVALLGLALYHGLYGLRTILFELSLKPAAEKALSALLLALGLGLFALGSWAAVAAHRAAALGGT